MVYADPDSKRQYAEVYERDMRQERAEAGLCIRCGYDLEPECDTLTCLDCLTALHDWPLAESRCAHWARVGRL